jgi:hypothetical protein
MFPPHKLYEGALTAAAVFFGAWLIESPTPWRHFGSGVFLGLAAFFGRNHGLYCGLRSPRCSGSSIITPRSAAFG